MLQDVRFALRLFARQRGFFVTTVLTIALGVGLSATVFAVVDGVLFRSLPYREPGRLVAVYGTDRAAQDLSMAVSPRELAAWRAGSHTFAQLEGYSVGGPLAQIRGADGSLRVRTASVTSGFLEMLGVDTALGRRLLDEDFRPGAPPAAMISHRIWVTAFGGAADVLGRTIIEGDQPRTIVGVLPRAFVFPMPQRRFAPDVVVPFDAAPADAASRPARYLYLIGRLAAESSLPRAHADIAAIVRRSQPPVAGSAAMSAGVLDSARLTDLRRDLTDQTRGVMWLVFGAVAAVFMISCINVVGLLLAHGEERRRELAIRAAIGAGRWSLLRQLLVEAAVLALVGTATGWLVSALAFGAVVRQIPPWMQLLGQPRMEGRAAAFAGLMALLTLAMSAIVPALRASTQKPQTALARESRSASSGRRGRHALLLVQVALGTLLLSAGSIMLRSWLRLYGEASGIDAENVIAVRSLPAGLTDAPGRTRYNRAVAEAVRRVPGVRSVAFADLPLLQQAMRGSPFVPPARVKDEAGMETDLTVTPGYFSTMGIRLLQGRELRPDDRGRAVVISDGLRRRYWPDRSPVGELIRYGEGHREIIGVVGDTRDYAFDRVPTPTLYHVWDEQRASIATVLVRFSGPSSAVMRGIRAAVRGADDEAAITMLSTVEDLLSTSVAERNFNTMLFGAFSLAGIVVALTGIYGLVAFVVARREREMGIRLALGANGRALELFVMGGTLRWVAGGLAAGVVAALLLGHYLKPFVYHVEPTDPGTLGLVAVSFLTISAVASYIPARRAARVDPMIALRAE
jgi:predicted permease